MVKSYSILYCDAPWRFEVWDREGGLEKSPDAHYKTMTVKEMMELQPDVADDAYLAMWVYDPMLPEALRLATAWGFPTYVTVLFRWLKSADGQLRLFEVGERLNFGLGYHTRGGGCEECWLFKRGDGLPVLRHDIRKEFYSTIREHSRKPDEVPGWIVDLYGDVPRAEMFARTRRLGWDQIYSNEADKF